MKQTIAQLLKVRILLLSSILIPICLRAANPPFQRLNILIIVADDLGWTDVGFHGGWIRTPNLDQLARESLVLEQFYVAPMCSPTRAALLTGRYWSRFGVTTATNDQVLPFGTLTLASVLGFAGYETGVTGKWHLGSKAEFGPLKFGFDHSYGSLAGGVGPYNHRYKKGPFSKTWHRDDRLTEERGHVTDLITEEAIRWIETRGARPFFLYVPFTAPHIPIDEPAERLDPYRHIEPLSKRHYAASVSHLDEAIGRILGALNRTRKRDNTLVIFFSDNGATPGARNDDLQYPGTYPPGSAGGSNAPLRGNKTEVYEGGIRVPALVNYPAAIKAGKFNAPLHVVDWMPTLCGLADVQPEGDPKWDGQNIWPLLTGKTEAVNRILYWAGTHFRSAALRSGAWKLVVQREPDAKTELFDLSADPFEKRDLAQEEPDRVAKLQAELLRQAARDRDSVVSSSPPSR